MRRIVGGALLLGHVWCASAPAEPKVAKAVAPVGIANTGNLCYMSAALQALFWLPDVRAHAMAPDGGRHADAVHMALGSLFARMQATEAGCVSAGLEFLPTVAAGHRGIVSPGDLDDADAFLRLLSRQAFATMDARVLGVQRQIWLLAAVPGRRDVALLFAPRVVREAAGLQVNVLESNGQPVHSIVNQSAPVTYKFYASEHTDDYNFALVDAHGRAVGVEGLPDDASLSQTLAYLGVTSHASLSCRQVVRLAGELPRILALSASKFSWDGRRGRSVWNRDIVTRFEQAISVASHSPDSPFAVDPVELLRLGVTEAHAGALPSASARGQSVDYVLHGVIFYLPRRRHYVAAVCTDTARSTWHLFDDSSVTELEGPPALNTETGKTVLVNKATGRGRRGSSGTQPYLFFYVRRDTRDAWGAGGLSRAALPVAPQCEVTARLFAVMRDLRGATGALLEFPERAAQQLVEPQRPHYRKAERRLLRAQARRARRSSSSDSLSD